MACSISKELVACGAIGSLCLYGTAQIGKVGFREVRKLAANDQGMAALVAAALTAQFIVTTGGTGALLCTIAYSD